MALSELLSYEGNAGLAAGSGNGATLGVGEFKNTLDAVDKFTAFTMQVNRDMWVESNLEMQKTANEAAKSLAVEYGDLNPEDRDVVDKNVSEMYAFYQKNPNAVRYIVDPNDPTKNNSKQYNEFLQLKQKLDRNIVRGNIRAQQLAQIGTTRSTITDPEKLKQFDALIQKERVKPIDENLLIPPDIAPFNPSAYYEKKSANGEASYEFLQRFPNDILTVTKNLFDPIKAFNAVATDIYGNTPVSNELKKSLALQRIGIDQVMRRNVRKDVDGNDILDMKSLEADPEAQPFLTQIKTFNEHVNTLNNTDWVEGGRPTGKKIINLMGYNEPIPKIDIANITDKDLVMMAMTYKAYMKTGVKATPTGYAIKMSEQYLTAKAQKDALQWNKDKFWNEINQGKAKEDAIAQEKILSYYNLVNRPEFTNATDEKFGTEVSTGKKVSLGYEVAVTPQLSKIFSIKKDKTKTTTKATDGSGAYTNQGFTSTTDESSLKIPAKIYVMPDKSGNANRNTVNVQYEDGTKKFFAAPDVFTAFNGMFGDDEKTQAKLSEISMRKLAEWGMTQPDIYGIKKKIGNMYNREQPPLAPAPPVKQKTAPTTNNNNNKKAQPY